MRAAARAIFNARGRAPVRSRDCRSKQPIALRRSVSASGSNAGLLCIFEAAPIVSKANPLAAGDVWQEAEAVSGSQSICGALHPERGPCVARGLGSAIRAGSNLTK